MRADYIIVGSGITGATIARFLQDSGREVVVIERRNRVGGNVVDEIHSSGIRYNLYGPHYFRTNSPALWDYVQRFSPFTPFEAVVKTMVDGKVQDWPVTQEMLGNFAPLPEGRGSNFEEEHLRRFPKGIYEKYIKAYTEKQWGIPASSLDAPRARPIEIRKDGDKRLNTKKFQGIPEHGYSAWVESMLNGIEVFTDTDYLDNRNEIVAKKHLVYTGPIDAFFDYAHGKLPSRSQQRQTFLCDANYILPACQLNYPSPTLEFIRLIEWKRIWPMASDKTLITAETPIDGGDEYPLPTREARELYARYRYAADALENITIAGRCGEYRYYDMDQAIARGLTIAMEIIGV
jgi:UDP-galactopyranose mutase